MITVRRLKIATVRMDGRILSKVPLKKVYSLEDWQHVSVKDKGRRKLSSKLSELSSSNSVLKPGYYLIDRIIDSKYDNLENKLHFLVRWKNCDPSLDSWISESDLLDKNLIFQYFLSRAGLKQKDFKEMN